jgi:hypothetical protein
MTSTKVQTRTKQQEAPNDKHQGPNKDQADKQQISNMKKKPSTIQTTKHDKSRLFPRLEFAVYQFGSCLLFGACDLELFAVWFLFVIWCLRFGTCI